MILNILKINEIYEGRIFHFLFFLFLLSYVVSQLEVLVYIKTY